MSKKQTRTLIIGDMHSPVCRKDYIPFLKKTAQKYKTNRTIMIGDLVDWHSISFHDKEYSLRDPEEEYRQALKQVQQVYKAFPECSWLIGHHDSLTQRQANTVGLPLSSLQSYQDLWKVPNWEVIPRVGSIIENDVLYQHGDRGKGGAFPALANAKEEHISVVQGHDHMSAGGQFSANKRHRIFGLQVGCGIDVTSAQMNYGIKFNRKPILGCGLVIGQVPYFEPMLLK